MSEIEHTLEKGAKISGVVVFLIGVADKLGSVIFLPFVTDPAALSNLEKVNQVGSDLFFTGLGLIATGYIVELAANSRSKEATISKKKTSSKKNPNL